MSDWPIVAIEDVAEKIAMGPFGSNIKVETFVGSGIPIISGQHLHGVSLEDKDYKFITEEHADKLKNSNVFRGDVVFTHAGNIGQAAYIPDTCAYSRYVISQRQFYLRCDRKMVVPEFIAYYFHSREGRYKLLSNTSQVGVPSIAQPSTHLKSIELALPSLSEQKSIVEVLGTLDRKIQNNRKQNQTLEAIAQTLFKRWFVEFEFPDENGNPYKSSGGAMQPSELGEIPVAWEIGQLISLAKTISKGTTPTQLQIRKATDEPCIKFLKVKDIDDSGVIDRTTLTKIPPSVHTTTLKRSILKEGDLLFSIAGTIGRVSVVEPDLDNSNANQAIAFIRLAEPDLHLGLCLQHLRSARIKNDVTSSIVQGVQANVSLASIGSLQIVIPNNRVLTEWNKVFYPIYEKQRINSVETRTLSNLKDALLPKLMSGELRVA